MDLVMQGGGVDGSRRRRPFQIEKTADKKILRYEWG